MIKIEIHEEYGSPFQKKVIRDAIEYTLKDYYHIEDFAQGSLL